MNAEGFPVIRPLVARHVEDAAFYWGQIDSAINAPLMTLDRLAHFQHLLGCHMGGLKSAGETGWELALAALSRWLQPGEAYVCTMLALEEKSRLDKLLALVGAAPDQMLRGVISALVSAPSSAAADVIGAWSASDAGPVAQVAALRAVALMAGQDMLALPASDYLTSANPHVRAAAARVSDLRLALDDSELAVRAEAAIAALKREPGARAVLIDCVHEQARLQAAATGWPARQATRRLQRWVARLAAGTPIGEPGVEALLGSLPPRVAATFILWHGDLAFAPFLLEYMAHEEEARHAGWVWQTLTGVDLAANGLTLPDRKVDAPGARISQAQRDSDNGLVLPNAAALRAFPMPRQPGGSRVLLGRKFDLDSAPEFLAQPSQAVRALAAAWLKDEGVHIDVRAPVGQQRAAAASLIRNDRRAA